MEGDRGVERMRGAVRGVRVKGGSVGVAKVFGQKHGGAERGCPLEDLGAQVLEEGSGAPATKQHDVGGGVASQEECHGGSRLK